MDEQLQVPEPVNDSLNGHEWRREKTISDEIAGMLVTQIGNELHNHNVYRTFQNYFALQGLDKIARYYEMRAIEEDHHHLWILNHLNDADVPFAYPAIKPVEFAIENNVDPFKHTVDLEIRTTAGLTKIVDKAIEEKDWETEEWLKRTLIAEQHEEESTSRTALDIAQSDASWLTKGKYILRLLTKSSSDRSE